MYIDQSASVPISQMVLTREVLPYFWQPNIIYSVVSFSYLIHFAGLPREAVDVIELHDCFSANELITYEALGLCEPGTCNIYTCTMGHCNVSC